MYMMVCHVPQFIFFNAISIVLDVLRLSMAPDGMHGFFLLVLLQIAGMLCKVRHTYGPGTGDCPAHHMPDARVPIPSATDQQRGEYTRRRHM
jgi:hypothetical protein